MGLRLGDKAVANFSSRERTLQVISIKNGLLDAHLD